MIVYWTEGEIPSLYFLIQPQDGLTRKLYERAHDVDSFDLVDDDRLQEIPRSCFQLAWISGPHGSGAPVGKYGSVLMVATGIGIAAQLPYLKELIWGFNHCEIRTRRIHLVWQLNFVGIVYVSEMMMVMLTEVGDQIGAVGIINQMLKEDVKDKGYVRYPNIPEFDGWPDLDQIFRISIYFAREDKSDGGSHGSEGENARVFFHKGRMDLEGLLKALMDGRCGEDYEAERSDQLVKDRGKLLVTGTSSHCK